MQYSVFDTSPDKHPERVFIVEHWLEKIEALIPLFDDKDPALSRPYLQSLNAMITGMRETITSGEDLLDLPESVDFQRFIQTIKRKSATMRSKEAADELNQKIAKRVAEKRAKLKQDGNLVNAFQCLSDIPGVDMTKHLEISIAAGIDFSPALKLANEAKVQMNQLDVFDTSELHRLNSVKNNPSLQSGTILALAKDLSGVLRDDRRADPRWRVSRIIKNSRILTINVSPVRPENIKGTRAQLIKNGMIRVKQ